MVHFAQKIGFVVAGRADSPVLKEETNISAALHNRLPARNLQIYGTLLQIFT